MIQNEQKSSGIDISGCAHRLSNTERIFLWGVRSKIAVVARIVGDVAEKDLVQSIKKVRQMHPLAGCKIIFDDHNDAWCSTENVPETGLRVVPRRSENQWFDEIRREHLIPFEPEKGPLVRFVLVYSPQVSELIALAQHSICDGTAVANLIRDILICYSEPAKDVKTIQPPALTDYVLKDEAPSQSKTTGEAAINNLNKQWRERPYRFSEADFIEIHNAFWKKFNYSMVLLQLEPDETSDLIDRCRENDVTIISALTAAFVAACQEVLGALPEDKRTIGIPFDLRRHLEEDIEEAFCFFAGDFNLQFSYRQEKPFWENAQELHRTIQERVKMLDASGLDMRFFDPTLVDAIFGYAQYVQRIPEAFERTENLSRFARDSKNIAFAVSKKIISRRPGMIVTNLGRLDFPQAYGDLRLDRMFFAPPASETIPIILGGVGIGGCLTLCLVYLENKELGGRPLSENMIRIRNRALELLGFPEKEIERAM
ncbi:Alcohol acetyltransferase [uncultured archaeon]|nr:Alcohol acetyltransferase [uncultured archaeon]